MAEQVYAKDAEEFNQVERTGKRQYAKVPGRGLYRHPNGEEAIVIDDPLWGNTMAQGFTRLGFKFVRDVEPDEVKTLPEMAMDKTEAAAGDLKGLNARMALLEKEAEKKTELENEVAKLRAELAQKEADAEAVKEAQVKKDEAAAAKQVEADKKNVATAGEVTTSDAQAESAKRAQESAKEQTKVREPATGDTNTKVKEKEGK
jgi:hypothetical protein